MAGLHPIIVITGATGAIGSATAALLARRGARLLLLNRPSDRLDSIVTALDRDNRVSSVEVDLASMASVRAAARQISRTVAHVDALINTAAVYTSELARRAKRWEVRAYAYHPGLVRSDLMREASRPIRLFSRLVSRRPDRAAEDLAQLATSPAFESTSGWLYKGDRRIDAPKSTLEPEAQRGLWTRSAELVELDNSVFCG